MVCILNKIHIISPLALSQWGEVDCKVPMVGASWTNYSTSMWNVFNMMGNKPYRWAYTGIGYCKREVKFGAHRLATVYLALLFCYSMKNKEGDTQLLLMYSEVVSEIEGHFNTSPLMTSTVFCWTFSSVTHSPKKSWPSLIMKKDFWFFSVNTCGNKNTSCLAKHDTGRWRRTWGSNKMLHQLQRKQQHVLHLCKDRFTSSLWSYSVCPLVQDCKEPKTSPSSFLWVLLMWAGRKEKAKEMK